MSNDPACIFCKILRGEIGSVKIHEDQDTLSFMDVMPQSPGHCLVIPKRHAADILEISADEAAVLIRATQRLAKAVKSALLPDGIGVYQFNGNAAGQTVFHVHFHVIPRHAGAELGFHARQMADPATLYPLASKIAAAFSQ
ncbi:MAG: HIT family protein [Alphaproteobacteria bacterium]|nr:HIT family protein [Alphaproteobacteria bacterium]